MRAKMPSSQSRVVACVATVVSVLAATATADAAISCGRISAPPDVILKGLKASKQAVPISQDSRYFAYMVEATNTVWTFTKKNNPAHPAVVCRQIVEKNGNIELVMNAKCGGTKSACDAMMREFRQMNEAMTRDIQKSKSGN